MNAYDMYRQQVVTTMTQGEMLLKLYEETLRQVDIGRRSIEENDSAAMDTALGKAQKIVQYLRSVLDARYEISRSLARLYEYFHSQLVMASVKKDVKILDELEPLIRELKDTFSECDKLDRSSRVTAAARSVV